jgi:hypothetical protein
MFHFTNFLVRNLRPCVHIDEQSDRTVCVIMGMGRTGVSWLVTRLLHTRQAPAVFIEAELHYALLGSAWKMDSVRK